MRDIKFRVWNGNQFVTKSDTYIKTSNGSLWDYEEDYGGTFTSHKKLWSADGKIQQYIGLKDKNGKEIYEGDIVKTIYGYIGNVTFDTNLGAYRILSDKTSIPITTYRFDENQKPVGLVDVVDEIIGNIFENPELLKYE